MERAALDLLKGYASLFIQRWDQYAVQQRDGSYWRVREPLTLEHLAAHLAGRWTLGTYLLDDACRCSFAVFDADLPDGLECLALLAGELTAQGIPSVLEASRRGGHLWVFFAGALSAQVVRDVLLPYARAFRVELYPKQERLSADGVGSLIRLPLGVHQRSRGWYPFVQLTPEWELAPVGATVWECCAWLCEQVQRVSLPETARTAASATMGESQAVRDQRVLSPAGASSIRLWCQAQDIFAVIGRYVALDRRGVGSCPFKAHHYRGDRRPSFQVFGGPDAHWYCYTWRQAGDLFDFLRLYHDLSPSEAWRRLQEGTLC